MYRILCLMAVTLFFGCRKADTQAPAINLLSPSDLQVFSNGQTVDIRAEISDKEGIHMVHLTVLDRTTNGHLVHFEEHPDAKTYTVRQSFSPQPGRSYTIEVGAEDHDQNAATKEITVSAN